MKGTGVSVGSYLMKAFHCIVSYLSCTACVTDSDTRCRVSRVGAIRAVK
jgi:hypothetical protein